MEKRCRKCGWDIPRRAKVCPNCGLAAEDGRAQFRTADQTEPEISLSSAPGDATGFPVSSEISSSTATANTDKAKILKLLAFIFAIIVCVASIAIYFTLLLGMSASMLDAAAGFDLAADDVDYIVNLYTGVGAFCLAVITAQLFIAARCWRIYRGKSRSTVPFVVVAFTLSNIVSGILLCVLSADERPKEG